VKDLKTGKAQPTTVSRDGFPVSHRIRIEKTFAFRKIDDAWRCNAGALLPVDSGMALGAR
jgi:hypothetical protein